MSATVAILGATSQLARDFVRASGDRSAPPLTLFARDPSRVERQLALDNLPERFPVHALDTFGGDRHSAIINFIGVGDPARAAALGAGIFGVTHDWDQRVLTYLDQRPDTRYVFLSSGAVYGEGFEQAAGEQTPASYPVNNLGPQHYYGLAKLSAEAGHRASGHSIVDLRIFNYVSRTGDWAARFLISDAVRSLRDGTVLETVNQEIVRDYLGPRGLFALISACLAAPAGTNAPVDAYSAAPIGKAELLGLLSQRFGLRYRLVDRTDAVEATGFKRNYYSTNRVAAAWGYAPPQSSAEAILEEVAAMLAEAL